ncbi:unnamed protein product [Tuber aestivum]|uniref:Large ribosomal subunit protein mL53 n=1 Tax=Tuber aestivum TaxID=59557 RepID=A0A292Q7L3_9PEZI|nr:unnamed protein product [Tuber aestivum]
MITKYLTTVSVAFNPFSKAGRTARIFMALLGPYTRETMKIKTTVLNRDSEVGGRVEVRFKDGKEFQMDTSKMTIADIVEEVDRHSRSLKRADDLSG